MNTPLATYRLQFHPGFGFAQALVALPYLKRLGISHVYASPIFAARPGSEHGYDVCDHQRLNPELGGEEGFAKLRAAARDLGLFWIQDIVPNHMAVAGENRTLVDLLENGEASRFHPFFDIDWDHPLEGLKGRMLAPFLGDLYGRTLEKGEISLGFDEDGFFARYYSLRLPLALDTYPLLLTRGLGALRARLGRDDPDFLKFTGVLYAIKNLPAESLEERYDQISFIKRMLHELYAQSEAVRGHMDAVLREANDEASRDLLDDILARQRFRLSYWKVAGEEINYRRFFSINDLISLRVENEAVFDHSHRMILERVASGDFDGLRVDHVDGLYDPSAYLRRLRDKAGDIYLTVEKILIGNEPLPAFWPVQGATGYEFLNTVTSLLVEPSNARAFGRAYVGYAGRRPPLARIVAEKKRGIIATHLSGDVDNLARLVKNVASRDRHAFDITLPALRQAIAELLTAFPVYRTYLSRDSFRPADLGYIREAVRQSRKASPLLASEFDFLERFLLLDFPERLGQEERGQWLHIAMRFQQMTGPLMAKGLEDTAFYVHNRLICLNEVGGEPGRFGLPLDEAHAILAERARDWPKAMNATATHDTKRGEDARARLAALSQFPGEWRELLRALTRALAKSRRKAQAANGPPGDPDAAQDVTQDAAQDIPTRNDEYMIAQAALAALPFGGAGKDRFRERLEAFLVKALREGKENTGWLRPDEEYEKTALETARRLFRPGKNAFAKACQALLATLTRPGVTASLCQTLLKIAAPGIPDIYQGTELWDFSFVDPDNRRPVDFAARESLLAHMEAAFADNPERLVRELLATPEDGRVKLFALWRGLSLRRSQTALFAEGSYEPVAVEGPGAACVFAFARRLGPALALAILPVRAAPLFGGDYPLGARWGETRLVLPEESLDGPPPLMINAFTDKRLPRGRIVFVRDALSDFPVSLLTGEPDRTTS